MIVINNKELGEEIRAILLEFVNKAGGETKYVEELCDILDKRLEVLDTLYKNIDEENKMEKDVITDENEDIKPADVSYYEYMNVVRENEELKETIVKLVKKLRK